MDILEERILCDALKSKICSAEEAALLLKDGMTVAVSGFTLSSYPKAVPVALAKRVQNGEHIKLSLYSGASTGDELDGIWADNGILDHRMPYQTNRKVRGATNRGELCFSDIHLGMFPQNLMYGFYKKPDIAIVEAVGITENGGIIPANSVGIMPQAIKLADKVIVEINAENSMDYYGLHDIAMLKNPPNRGVINIKNVRDRIGKPYISCPKKKIAAIVFTNQPDGHRKAIPITENYTKMADHLMDFFESEVRFGRLPENLLPIQSGVGTVSNSVLEGMRNSKFENLEFLWNSTVSGILHGDKVTGMVLKDVHSGEEREVLCDGIFVSIGRTPNTALLKDQVDLDSQGYVKAGESCRTNIPGVFAVGDVRTKALRQIVTAAADGAVAVHYADEYLTSRQ